MRRGFGGPSTNLGNLAGLGSGVAAALAADLDTVGGVSSFGGVGAFTSLYLGSASGFTGYITENVASAFFLTGIDHGYSYYKIDNRQDVSVFTHNFAASSVQTLPNGATSQFRLASFNPGTVTLAGTTTISTANHGVGLYVNSPTYAQSGGAVVVTTISTFYCKQPVAGSSVTLTNSYAGYIDGCAAVIQGRTGQTALLVKGIASRTTALVQLQTSAGASLGNVGGTVFNDFTDTSTTHTDGTEDDLYSYTTAANTFAIDGDSIEQIEHVQLVSSATAARRVKKYFAGTLIFDSGSLTLSLGGDFCIYTVVIRESSTVVRCTVSVTTTSASTVPYSTYTRITSLTLTSTNIIKTTGIASGAGAASGDILDKLSKVFVFPAA